MKTKWKVVSPYTGIEEDAPAASAGGGNIAGIGIDHPDRPGSGEPGIDPKKKKKHTLIDRDGKIDGRTKAYREHRKKLEAARQRRMEMQKKSGFIENVLDKINEYASGYDKANPVASLNAAKSSSGYELYHKDFSSAMQHAYAFAKKKAAEQNPWGEGATTLEWTVPSPPNFHTFEELPKFVDDQETEKSHS